MKLKYSLIKKLNNKKVVVYAISKNEEIKIVEDNSVSPDGVIVETLNTRLDSRISTQIAEIAAKMLTGTNDELEQE